MLSYSKLFRIFALPNHDKHPRTMTLKEKIAQALQATQVPNIDKLLRYMEEMRDEIKRLYHESSEKKAALYLHDVMMIRDGEKCEYPFTEPWPDDLLLVLGGKFETFVVLAEKVERLK